MPFKEGQEKKGGRKKGSLNKYTYEIKEALSKIISESSDSLIKDLKEMNPKDRWGVLVKLLPFIIPKETPFDLAQLTDDQVQELYKRELENKEDEK